MSATISRAFQPYDGERTSAASQFWVIPRYGYRELFRSRVTLILFVASFFFPVVFLAAIYARQNAQVLAIFGRQILDGLQIDAGAYIVLTYAQSWFAFYLALWAGPPLLGRDMANNGLPLFLSRPMTRSAYIAGKLMVLLGPLSIVTWVMGILVLLFQASFEGGAWLAANTRLFAAVFVGSWVSILLYSLVALALSALLRRRWMARGAMLGSLFILRGVAGIVNLLFNAHWGSLLSPTEVQVTILSGLFGEDRWFGALEMRPDISTGSAWVVFALLCAACLAVLYRRVRAYEVVR
ncbi:MAG: hypothetical protein U0470_04155 [Anaerolineae bacterium]